MGFLLFFFVEILLFFPPSIANIGSFFLYRHKSLYTYRYKDLFSMSAEALFYFTKFQSKGDAGTLNEVKGGVTLSQKGISVDARLSSIEDELYGEKKNGEFFFFEKKYKKKSSLQSKAAHLRQGGCTKTLKSAQTADSRFIVHIELEDQPTPITL